MLDYAESDFWLFIISTHKSHIFLSYEERNVY